MKRTTIAIATALMALVLSPPGQGQDANMWRPAVTATPVAAPVVSPTGQVWQPAVYASPQEPGVYAALPTQMAAFGGTIAESGGCATGDCASRAGSGAAEYAACCDDWLHDFLSDRFGVCGTWGGVEFLHLWAQGRTLPPLITTSPTGTARPVAGVLPGASILFGNGRIGDDRQSAGRVTFGVWLDDCESTGFGVRLFGIEGSNAGMTCFSDATGVPIYGVPFNNVQSGLADALLASYPGELAGRVSATTSQDVLTGDMYLRALLLRCDGLRLDLVGGYHYTQVSDGVNVNVNTTAIDPAGIFPVGSTFDIIDRFDVRNDFHGASAGLQSEILHGCWRVHGLAKVSVGNMHEVLTVSGQTTTHVAGGASSVTSGGLFSQTSNIGTFSRDETTFVPELAMSMGYQVTNHMEMTVGYSCIYWANVLEAGDQIDTFVDLSQTVARPAINLRDTEFWVQGISFGLNWNY